MLSTKQDDTEEAILLHPETPWTLIQSYFANKHLPRLVRHQIESYNDFVNFQLARTIDMFNPVRVASDHDFDPKTGLHALELFVQFENFGLQRPQIQENNGSVRLNFPQPSRLRNFTYSSTMTVDLNIQIVVRSGANLEFHKTFLKTMPNIQIGKLPIMLKSSVCLLEQYPHHDHVRTGECKYDAGGYFIINGSEKTVLGQERASENKIYVYNVAKNSNKYSFQAEIKSVPDHKCISPKQVNMMLLQRNNGFGHAIHVQMPKMKTPIPLFVLFRALGVVSDKAICETILLDIAVEKHRPLLESLQASIMDAQRMVTPEEATKAYVQQVMFSTAHMDRETAAKRKGDYAKEMLRSDLFPHCQTMTQKVWFLGYMAQRLLMVRHEWLPPDDRDSYINKRIDLTGTLLNNLFRNYFNKMVKDMEKQLVKEINGGSWRATDDFMNIVSPSNIYKLIKSTTVENGLRRALATGDFGVKHINSTKVGVAQVLNRLTYTSTLSHLRRLSASIDKSGKLVPPRKLHSSSFGFICPVETPEGQSVGVVKNLSYMAHVTIASSSAPLYEIISPLVDALPAIDSMGSGGGGGGQGVAQAASIAKKTKVFINGCWMGLAREGESMQLFRDLKAKKTSGILNVYTAIVFDFKLNEIRVCNEAGRLTRPLLRIDSDTQRPFLSSAILEALQEGARGGLGNTLQWEDLLTGMRSLNGQAVLEYIDAEEQATSLLAMWPRDLDGMEEVVNKVTDRGGKVGGAGHGVVATCPFRRGLLPPRYNYLEIHPSTILGVLASCIPFPEHNQSPRNTYQCAQAKQAMGVYVSNYEHRMDKTAYVLMNPARPLVDTRIMEMIHLNEIPSGFNCMVAIMSYTGYNQEDSLLISKGAVDRGLFQATIYHTEKDEDKQKINGEEEIRCKPDPKKTKGMKFANYDKVDGKGLIPENSFIAHRDVIMAKVVPIKENKANPMQPIKFSDESKICRTNGEETYAGKRLTGKNGDGYSFAKVVLRTLRAPQIGDKFSSRSGQKGTVGNLIPEEDMPFTRNGLRPDMILNPHAIPSRMTIAQLKETLVGKVLLEKGLFGDGTSFGRMDIAEISAELQKVGYESRGNELFYDALTGEPMECSVFVGPVFYQRLKHMVIDKQHSRSIGPMVNLTRQPAEGRSRDGGLRFGEMERDCMIAHGASRFTKGRLYDASDKYSVHVCKRCGLIAAYNDIMQIHYCCTCDNRTDFAYVEIPYALKLLSHELMSMNITPRFITE